MTTRRNKKNKRKTAKKGGADAQQKGQAAVLRKYFDYRPYTTIVSNPSPYKDTKGTDLSYKEVLNSIIHSGEMIGSRKDSKNPNTDMSHRNVPEVDNQLNRVKQEFKRMLYDLAYDGKENLAGKNGNVFNDNDVQASLHVDNIKNAIQTGRDDRRTGVAQRANPVFGGKRKTLKKGGADLLQKGKAAEVRVYFEDNNDPNNFVDNPGNVNDRKSYYTALSEIVHSDDMTNRNSKDKYGDKINHFHDLKNAYSADAEALLMEASQNLYNKIVAKQKIENPVKFHHVFDNNENVNGLPIYNQHHKDEILLRYKLDKLFIRNDKSVVFNNEEIDFLHLNPIIGANFPKYNTDQRFIIYLIYLVHKGMINHITILTKNNVDANFSNLPSVYKTRFVDLLQPYWEDIIKNSDYSEIFDEKNQFIGEFANMPSVIHRLLTRVINIKLQEKQVDIAKQRKETEIMDKEDQYAKKMRKEEARRLIEMENEKRRQLLREEIQKQEIQKLEPYEVLATDLKKYNIDINSTDKGESILEKITKNELARKDTNISNNTKNMDDETFVKNLKTAYESMGK
jgi:hypothetical protein